MRSLNELTFQIELPLKPADAIDRIDAACDESALGLEGVREGERGNGGIRSGRRRMWGNVDGHWFRVRAIGIGYTAPVADGYVVAAGTGSRVVVNGEMDPEGTRLARQTRWGGTIGGFIALLVGFAGEPGTLIPALLFGAVFFGIAWAGYRWQINAARRTRQVLMDVLTGPPPSPAKWRPRVPGRPFNDRPLI